MQSQFLLLTLTSFATGTTLLPFFSPCKPTQLCEGVAACRFGICIPQTTPVSLSYSNENGLNANTFIRHTPNTVINSFKPFIMNHNPSVTTYLQGAVRLPAKCQPRCLGSASCIRGLCTCLSSSAIYSTLNGCSGVFKVTAVPKQRVPQALPGGVCIPGVECTGGSSCFLGVCTCPPELVQQGTVCVSRIFGFPYKSGHITI